MKPYPSLLLALGLAACGSEAVSTDAGPDDAAPGPVLTGPFGEPLAGITEEERAAFERGRALATRSWSPEDGLGPSFDASRCMDCHARPTVGGSAARYRDVVLAQIVRDGEPLFSSFGDAAVAFDLRHGLSRRPATPAAFGRRNPSPLYGVGLLATLPDEVILERVDPGDEDGDGISGRAGFEHGRLARYGRKAQVGALEDFVRVSAFSLLGLTSQPLSTPQRMALPSFEESAFVGWGSAGSLGDVDAVSDPELGAEALFDLVSFVMLLAAPEPEPRSTRADTGAQVFEAIGCASCHVPALTGRLGPVPLYSDLLLHDMGPGLAEDYRTGVASGAEFRTQPLWGVAAAGPHLHDGRADTLDEAIRWHGGEARAAKERYEALADGERGALIAFLESLGGRARPGSLPEGAPIPSGLGAPVPLSAPDLERFVAGRALFDRDLSPREGLGPLFNADSCRACHASPVLGGAGSLGVSALRQGIRQGDGSVRAPRAGPRLHRHRNPEPVGWQLPEPHPDADVFELRSAPPLFGAGLIERVPEAAIAAREDPDDLDGDGVRGVAHRLDDGRLGRFGHRAHLASIEDAVVDALTGDLGVTLGLESDADEVSDPEMSDVEVASLVFFVRSLASPPSRSVDAEGERVFGEIGCASCHVIFALEDGTPVPLYSDLLLHDVGGDVGVPAGNASGRQLRTAPLWGLASSAPYMHDGRASTVEAAVRRHAGEAARSAEAFAALAVAEREALLRFLDAL